MKGVNKMVRVINIDTKTKTIKISNEDKIDWITVKGTHVPIKEGESTKEAVKKFVGSKRPEAKKGKSQEALYKEKFAREKKTNTEREKKIEKEVDRALVRGGLTDDEISVLESRLNHYDIEKDEFLDAIKADAYSVKEIYTRLKNYDDDFATHLADFVEDNLDSKSKPEVSKKQPVEKSAKKQEEKKTQKFIPFVVEDHDTGDTRSFETRREAWDYFNKQKDNNFRADIRISRIDPDTGDFIEWLD